MVTDGVSRGRWRALKAIRLTWEGGVVFRNSTPLCSETEQGSDLTPSQNVSLTASCMMRSPVLESGRPNVVLGVSVSSAVDAL